MRIFAILIALFLAGHATAASINAKEIPGLIAKQPKPLLVFVYATWCPHCKTMYKPLKKLTVQKAGVNVLSLAVDNDEFSGINSYKIKGKEAVQSLQKAGISYEGKIPYVAIFDENGALAGQGMLDAKALEGLIDVQNKKVKPVDSTQKLDSNLKNKIEHLSAIPAPATKPEITPSKIEQEPEPDNGFSISVIDK